LGERRPPRQPTPPGEIGDDDAVEEAGERLVRAGDAAPLVRIDDEAVADVDDLVERLTVPVGAPAPAAVRGEVGDQQREHDGRRAASPLNRTSITSDRTSRPSPVAKSWTTASASTPLLRPGTGTRKIVRAGCRSARPARTRFARGSHLGGAQTTWVIVLVRSSGSPSVSWRQRCRASFRSTSATTPISGAS